MTFYWLIDESSLRYIGPRTTDLRDVHGHVIARTTRRFRRDLVMEGTGWLKDGRTVVYDQKIGGENRFRISGSKYGLSKLGCALVPYRTVAVDPRFIKLGSRLFIPQLQGTKLPDGSVHDGYFIADDRGHFRGSHIDVFTGVGARASRPFARKGYGSRSHVTVYLAGVSERGECRR